MINKLIAKKRNNSSGVEPDPQERLDVQMTPGSEGAATELESNPYFHHAPLQDMMTPRTPTPQPAAPSAEKPAEKTAEKTADSSGETTATTAAATTTAKPESGED